MQEHSQPDMEVAVGLTGFVEMVEAEMDSRPSADSLLA